MGRRSDHTREELRIKAINAAEKLVRGKGLSHLTARKVASEIGYAVGTIYNLFDNIDDLILHVNARTLDDMYEKMSKVKSIKSLAKAYLEYANTHPYLWGMLFEHKRKDREGLPVWYQKKIDRMFGLAEKVLEKDMVSNPRQIKKSAKVIWASIHGICALAISGTLETTKSDSASSMVNSVIDNYIKGIKAKP